MAKFCEWKEQDVVRRKGRKGAGRWGKVLKMWAAPSGNPLMVVEYSSGKRGYYCRPHNYDFPFSSWKNIFYEPYPKSIDYAQKVLMDQERIFRIGKKKYMPVLSTAIRPKIIERLLAEGFVRKAGRLSALLRRAGWPLEQYQQAVGIVFDQNVSVFELKKDIANFPW